jgi:UDP-N-acetylmuramate dehydrogenase
MADRSSVVSLSALRDHFGARLQENVLMSNYTTARVGGKVDGLLIATSALELEQAAAFLWQADIPFFLVGSGSNILIPDKGLRGVVIVNHARLVKIDTHTEKPTVFAESGANIGTIARQAALRGLSGMEWAGNIPGTLGGAIYGNAGANGSDMNASVLVADILHRTEGKVQWNAEKLQYSYRSSWLKKNPGQAVVLSARLKLSPSTAEDVKAAMETYSERRKTTQPTGASMGSMFKNPEGDFAGRLIDAAGLRGTRIGGAEISPAHANFFINQGGATAADFWRLIQLTRKLVNKKFGIDLQLEVELLGEWPPLQQNPGMEES